MNQDNSSEGDIFDLERVRSAEGATASTSPESTPKPPRQFSLGPIHFGAIAAILALAWIAWPHVMSASSASAELSPQASSDVAQSASTTDVLTALPADTEPAQPTTKEIELEAQVATLHAALNAVHERLTSCAIPAAPSAAPAAPPRAVQVRKAPNRSPPGVASSSTQNAKLAGFSLNTIYREQAWIEKDERTYVVQRGDAIEGVRILGIDARARKVTTDAGVIR